MMPFTKAKEYMRKEHGGKNDEFNMGHVEYEMCVVHFNGNFP